MEAASKKKLSKIEVILCDSGFTVWITEKKDGEYVRHWLIDGSVMKQTGQIKVAGTDRYKTGAIVLDDVISIVKTDNK